MAEPMMRSVILLLGFLLIVAGSHLDKEFDDAEETIRNAADRIGMEAAYQQLDNLHEMEKDVRKLETETSPEKRSIIKKALKLRQEAFHAFRIEAETHDSNEEESPSTQLLSQIQDMEQITASNPEIDRYQRGTLVSNLKAMKRDIHALDHASPSQESQLKRAIHLRMDAMRDFEQIPLQSPHLSPSTSSKLIQKAQNLIEDIQSRHSETHVQKSLQAMQTDLEMLATSTDPVDQRRIAHSLKNQMHRIQHP